jgi:hypothetical protein
MAQAGYRIFRLDRGNGRDVGGAGQSRTRPPAGGPDAAACFPRRAAAGAAIQ